MSFDNFLSLEPFSLDKNEKKKILSKRLVELTMHHANNCKEYQNILNCIGRDIEKIDSYEALPFLPVRLFKELQLKSIDDENIVKTMTSSGTTGQSVSRIFLDKITSTNQQKAMVKIVSDFTGSSRMPMIIVDCPSVLKDRNMFSARGAGILGFSMFGSKKIYALNDEMQLDVEGIKKFLDEHQGEKIFLFGFTFMVWQFFYKELVRLKEQGIIFDLSNAVLIHGGGWKKLISEAVSAAEFHDRLNEVCGIEFVHDYYGMVEQTGCIYMQCEYGHLHASIFSDVIIRNPKDFSVCDAGERGIIQVVSSIPESYPGHSLLTEDEGMILGEDDCPCGRKGKYFSVLGRIKNAEIRGCSDTFAANIDKDLIKNGKNNENEFGTSCIPKGIEYLVGSEQILKEVCNVPSKPLFDEEITEFLNEVSSVLMKNKVAKQFPDVITLAFWLRKSSINNLKNKYKKQDNNLHFGRGIAFHIAPSNVAVNYAYSLFSALMCGNINIVRVPSKNYPQVEMINEAIKKALDSFEHIKPYILLLRYERNKDINDYLSSICDTRIIWGGDLTIDEIRKSKLQPRATEVTFADRYSIAYIDSDMYLDSDNKANVAISFYNDTYLSDQNACTSPRIVIWGGKRKDEAKRIFWEYMYDYASKRYELPPVRAVDKLSNEYIAASYYGSQISENNRDNNLIYRINLNNAEILSPELMKNKGNCGFFFEYDSENVMEIRGICNSTRCQTLGYMGDISIVEPLLCSGIKGVDRVVEIGHTMDFDLVWDGYDLTERFTRTIHI